MSRPHSEDFKALVDRCAQEVIYAAFLDHAAKHEGAFYPAVNTFVGMAIRNLQQLGLCLAADARSILELTRPTVNRESNMRSELSSAEARAMLGFPRPTTIGETNIGPPELTSADVRANLEKWTRPARQGESDVESAVKAMTFTHEELASYTDLDILYRETIVRFEPLVVLAAMAHALRRYYELLNRYGCQDYVEKWRGELLVHSFPQPSAFEH